MMTTPTRSMESVSTVPPAPAWLQRDRAAKAVWAALAPKLLAAGLYLPIDQILLTMLCQAWVRHEAIRPHWLAAPALWATPFADARAHVRELAAKFLLIPEDRIHLADVDVEGRDRELVGIFDPATPLRPVRLTPEARRNLESWNARARAAGLLQDNPKSVNRRGPR